MRGPGGRRVAADANVARWNGQVLPSWQLAGEYGFTDVDGSRPDWGKYRAEVLEGSRADADPDDYR